MKTQKREMCSVCNVPLEGLKNTASDGKDYVVMMRCPKCGRTSQ